MSDDKPKPDLTAVPRPPAPPVRREKIDLRNAPSSMEQAAKRWSEKG